MPSTWHIAKNGAEPVNSIVSPETDILEGRNYWNTIYLKNPAIGKGGKLNGLFKVTSDFGTFNLTGFNYESDTSNSLGCNISLRTPEGNIAACVNDAWAGLHYLKLDVSRTFPGNVPVPVGDVNLKIDFIPHPNSAVKAPVEPFTFTVKSRQDQSVLLTEGLSINSPRATAIDLGAQAATDNRSSLYKTIYLRKGSNFGRLGGTWTLEGSPDIKIKQAGSATFGTANRAPADGRCNDKVAGNYSHQCVATAAASSLASSELFVELALSPSKAFVAGEEFHQATLKFTPSAVYPAEAIEPLVVDVSGTLKYDNRAVLTDTAILEESTAITSLDFGQLSHSSGRSTQKSLYLLAESQHGLLAGTWSIEGPASFTIQSVNAVMHGKGTGHYTCKGSSASNTSQSKYCAAPNDQSSATTPQNLVAVISYKPAPGQTEPLLKESAKLKFTPDVKYPMTDENIFEVALSGSSTATESIILTTGSDRNVESATSEHSYDIVGVGNSVSQKFYVRGLDLNENLNGTFILEGSPEFKIKSIKSANRNNNQETHCRNQSFSGYTATCGAAYDHPSVGASSDIVVEVTFNPTGAGAAGTKDYQAQLEFITSDSRIKEAAPLRVNLIGSGLYNQTAALSLNHLNTVESYADTVTYMTKPSFGYDKPIYLRGSTDYGKLSGRWVLSGDPIFQIHAVYVSNARSIAVNTSACSGAKIDPDKRGATCNPTAAPKVGASSDIAAWVRVYVPAGTASGTEYNGTLTFIPDADFPMEWRTPNSIKLHAIVE